MHRDKFPEKVPFRLTRMMVKAMEVSGIEGNFRTTCEQTMAVLRTNKKSVTAMLDAFVHDPLINWRLMPQKAGPADGDDAAAGGGVGGATSTPHTLDIAAPGRTSDQQPDRTHRERETLANYAQVRSREQSFRPSIFSSLRLLVSPSPCPSWCSCSHNCVVPVKCPL